MNCQKPIQSHICEDLSVYENNEYLIRKCLDDKWSLGVENGNPNPGKECCFQYELIVSLENLVIVFISFHYYFKCFFIFKIKDLCRVREPAFSNSIEKQISDLEKNCTEFGSDLSETYCQKFSVEPVTSAVCLKYIKRKVSTTLAFPQITPSNQNESTYDSTEGPEESETEEPELAEKDNNSSTILSPISQQFLSLILSLLLIFI